MTAMMTSPSFTIAGRFGAHVFQRMAQSPGRSGTGESEHDVLASEGERDGDLTPIQSFTSHGCFAPEACVRVNRSTSFSSNPACVASAVP
jgi:hypothetical protein